MIREVFDIINTSTGNVYLKVSLYVIRQTPMHRIAYCSSGKLQGYYISYSENSTIAYNMDPKRLSEYNINDQEIKTLIRNIKIEELVE